MRALHKAWDFNYADNGVSRGSERGTLFNLFLPSLSCPFSLTAKLPKAMDGVNGGGRGKRQGPASREVVVQGNIRFHFQFLYH